MNIKEQLVQECITVLNRKDVKHEIKTLVKPIIEMLLNELYPYLYILTIFVVLCFLMSVGNFFILFRNNFVYTKHI